MLSEVTKEILHHEGPAAIVTGSAQGPHLVATWNSYIQALGETTLAIPAGGFRATEANLKAGSGIQLLVASREVKGLRGQNGAGVRLSGQASLETSGPAYEAVKARFNWARAALVVRVAEDNQIQ